MKKKRTKALVSVCLALTVLFGSSSVAFAAEDAPAENDTMEVIAVTAAETSAASAASTASEAPTNADGTINASPNTGVPFPPMAAALLMLASVPVIFLTARKRETE